MTQQFLNAPSIEEAFAAYLNRWHLPSVQESWTDKAGRVRKPTLAQFTKRFGTDYNKRQSWLEKQDERSAGVDDLAERVAATDAKLDRLIGALTGSQDTEPEEILGSEDEDEVRNGVPTRLLKKLTGNGDAESESKEKFVKPENFNELPTYKQISFLLHRAIEDGDEYAIIPVKRGIIAECVSQIKDDGRSYADVASDLVSA